MGYPIPHVLFSVQTCLNNTYLHKMAWHLGNISHQSQACSDKLNQIQGTSTCLQFSTPSTGLRPKTCLPSNRHLFQFNSSCFTYLQVPLKKVPPSSSVFCLPTTFSVFFRRKRFHRRSDPKALQLPVGNLQRSSALFAGELLRVLEPNLFNGKIMDVWGHVSPQQQWEGFFSDFWKDFGGKWWESFQKVPEGNDSLCLCMSIFMIPGKLGA